MTTRPTIREDKAFKEGLAKAIYDEGASHGLCEDGLRDFIIEQIGPEYAPPPPGTCIVLYVEDQHGEDTREDVIFNGISTYKWKGFSIHGSDASDTFDYLKKVSTAVDVWA